MQNEINKFELATDLILNTKCNVFLTGKAGTGKTTFLRGLLNDCTPNHVVVAPTGIAAINARGVTAHSLFQLPFHPFLPDTPRMPSEVSEANREIIRKLELLIIDEVSMVRADMLDAIDCRLRSIRKRPEPFGGVQLLLIGDLFQLPPVVLPEEFEILKEHYDSMYFFDSKALKQTDFVTVELDKIFRQDDEEFKEILNSIREGNTSRYIIERLNKRYIPDFKPQKDAPYIRLVTHNAQSDKINREELENLEGEPMIFKAKILGEFPVSSYPAPASLMLKVGAHVMTLRNKSGEYCNGSLGVVTSLDDGKVKVKLFDRNKVIEIERETWDNIVYRLEEVDEQNVNGRSKGKKRKVIVEELLGSFCQYPLRPAWAITIHKSQGLTFDRAIIDASRSFMAGQTYVALSRCRSLKGIVLSEKIDWRAIKCDNKVKEFYRNEAERLPNTEKLDEMRRESYLKSLHSNLDASGIEEELIKLIQIVIEDGSKLDTNVINTLIAAHRDFSLTSGIRAEMYYAPIEALINETKSYSHNAHIQAMIANVAKRHLDSINELGVKLTTLEKLLEVSSKAKHRLDILNYAVTLYRTILESITKSGFNLLDRQCFIKSYDSSKHRVP